ncbi:hypothetical protein TNCV_788231 [Trichonephila clavipes]|nr:hypothetical protein TNCV_788231 [Trichonephila clavipes]
MCKKANGAMKNEFRGIHLPLSPTPSPMERKYRRFVLPDESFNLGSGNEGKREIVLNRRPELYRRKISDAFNQRSTLVKKSYVLMPCE